MPIYEYECTPCRTIYQTRHGMNDEPLRVCEKCRGPVERRFSMPHLILGRFSAPPKPSTRR